MVTKVVEQRLELEGDTLRLINLVAYSAHSRNVGRRFREAPPGVDGTSSDGCMTCSSPVLGRWLASSPMPTVSVGAFS